MVLRKSGAVINWIESNLCHWEPMGSIHVDCRGRQLKMYIVLENVIEIPISDPYQDLASDQGID